MPGLDTNVLVRWLVDDEPSQVARVGRLLQAAVDSGQPLRVPSTVALELEWVLRSRYGFEASDILMAFNALLETRELYFRTSPHSSGRCISTERPGRTSPTASMPAIAARTATGRCSPSTGRRPRLPGVQLVAG